jgi:hypothetical protein
METNHCPNCGSSDLVSRTVNDRLRAADPRGETFEIALQLPVWSCRVCKLCWQAQEAMAVMEAAYQKAIVARSPPRSAA